MAERIRESKNSLRFQIAFFEGLLDGSPDFIDALIPLGDAYTKIGEYAKGLEVDLRITRLRPRDTVAFYNLACSYSLLGRIQEAYNAIEKAIILGYADIKYMLRDKDLINLIGDEGFPEFIERTLNARGKQDFTG